MYYQLMVSDGRILYKSDITAVINYIFPKVMDYFGNIFLDIT